MRSGDVGQPVQQFDQSEKEWGSKNGVDTTVPSLRFPEPRLRLQTERLGSDSGGRKSLDSFSEKIDVGKYAIPTPFPS